MANGNYATGTKGPEVFAFRKGNPDKADAIGAALGIGLKVAFYGLGVAAFIKYLVA